MFAEQRLFVSDLNDFTCVLCNDITKLDVWGSSCFTHMWMPRDITDDLAINFGYGCRL